MLKKCWTDPRIVKKYLYDIIEVCRTGQDIDIRINSPFFAKMVFEGKKNYSYRKNYYTARRVMEAK